MKTGAPRVGVLQAGPLNLISDVAGVTVGHATLADAAVQTGVTVIRPHPGDMFRDKVPAAATVLNGFAKSVGLLQLGELGVLETPIALTNTFGVASVAQAQIRQAIAANPEIGRELPTVNPLVFECNDGYLNDIQAMAVAERDYLAACHCAQSGFEQGAVGAGRGMSCFQLKGGIGSASRLTRPIKEMDAAYTVGTLVLANFGKLPMLTVAGQAVGRTLQAAADQYDDSPEKGSIILIVATDAPLDARQLRRLSLRAGVGLARTGSVFGHGSGDLALAFSTSYTVPHTPERGMPGVPMLHDVLLDPLFQACAEAVEQAILNALWSAASVTGRDGNRRLGITEFIPDWPHWLAQTQQTQIQGQT
ncbi:P1 family peptidase [Paralcaligenes sp. KSB-10]|uniref:DmpA family aminopeptidase n=1 Tax=Paralcaligenes sp. KSB-10 TaxID=2901142 RepID=UPI001E301629|nr:P1 family peptidase [Paralcaligenes sp. KSB-10]UHL63891.1 P1 family peptidase [Paralcaligenes sp. KSB-10]